MRVKRGGRLLMGVLVVAAAWVWVTLPAGLSLDGARPQAALAAGADVGVDLRRALGDVARAWIARHPPETLDWSWGEGVLAFGMQRAHAVSGDPAPRQYLRAYLRHHLRAGLQVRWSDDTTPGLAAIERVAAGEAQWRPLVDRVVAYTMDAPRNADGLIEHLGRTRLPGVRLLFPEAWVDSLFHVVPTLMRYSALTGETRYRDEGARQLRLFLAALQDPASGLVTHACNGGAPAEAVPPFSERAFWARGNGWMLAALVDALAHLPGDHPDRPALLVGARRLEAALRSVQTPDGLFHTLLLSPDSYRETAGSALIVYAMARGLKLGVFPAQTRRHVQRGARGLLSVLRRRETGAEVTGTSLGTNPVQALYAWTPTADQVSYGVGAWLMAASAILDLAPGAAHAAR